MKPYTSSDKSYNMYLHTKNLDAGTGLFFRSAFRNILLILICICCSISSYATTFFYSGSGAWEEESNWTPSYPGTTININDEVFILDGTVSAPALIIHGELVILCNAFLNISGSVSIEGFVSNHGNLTAVSLQSQTSNFINTGAYVGGISSVSSTIFNYGTMQIPSGANYLNTFGIFDNYGQLIINGSVNIEIGSLINYNSVVNNGNMLNNIFPFDPFNPNGPVGAGIFENLGSWENNGNMTIYGRIENSEEFTNRGSINVFREGRLVNSGEFNNDGNITQNSLQEQILEVPIFNNSGVFSNDGVIISNGVINNSGTLINNNLLTNNTYEGSSLNHVGEINNSNIFNNAGSLFNNAIFINSSVFNNDRLLGGSGTYSGGVNNSATALIAPGNSIGTLTMEGPFDFGEGTYIAEIDASSSTFDSLSIEGDLMLSGDTLVVEWLSIPSGPGTFPILESSNRTGTFAHEILPSAPGYSVNLVYNPSDISVVVSTVLAVELLDFSATSLDNSVLLRWSTTHEENNEGFNVERTQDPNGKWEEIGFVKGKEYPNLKNDYTLIDNTPKEGINYYRLRQVDFDGAYELSDIRSIELKSYESGFSIYPNPSSTDLQILSFDQKAPENLDVIILDLSGRILHSQKIRADEGLNQIPVRTPDLSPGTYIIKLDGAKRQSQQKWMKLEN